MNNLCICKHKTKKLKEKALQDTITQFNRLRRVTFRNFFETVPLEINLMYCGNNKEQAIKFSTENKAQLCSESFHPHPSDFDRTQSERTILSDSSPCLPIIKQLLP